MTMITPSYLGETIEYSSLHACRSTLEDPTMTRVIMTTGDRGHAPGDGALLGAPASLRFDAPRGHHHEIRYSQSVLIESQLRLSA